MIRHFGLQSGCVLERPAADEPALCPRLCRKEATTIDAEIAAAVILTGAAATSQNPFGHIAHTENHAQNYSATRDQ